MRFGESIAAQITCVCFSSIKRIVFLGSWESFSFQHWGFIPENGPSGNPYCLLHFCAKHTRWGFWAVLGLVRLDPVVLSCPKSPAFEAQHRGEASEQLRELGVQLVLEGQFKTSGDALAPTLTFIFLRGTWTFFIPVTVLFSSILNLLFCGFSASWGHVAAPGL